MPSSTGRFYWLKLPTDFFDRFDIRYMRAQPDGDRAVILYLRLLLRTVQSGGRIDVSGVDDSPGNNLALLLGEDAGAMEKALALLEKLKLAECSGGLVILPEQEKMVGSESKSAERMRNKRRADASGTGAAPDRGEGHCDAADAQSDAEGAQCYAPGEPCSPVLFLRYAEVTPK